MCMYIYIGFRYIIIFQLYNILIYFILPTIKSRIHASRCSFLSSVFVLLIFKLGVHTIKLPIKSNYEIIGLTNLPIIVTE